MKKPISKIQLWLETSEDYLEGPIFTTTEATLVKDCREQALKTWNEEQIHMGGLTYTDLTNNIVSCPIHDEAFPEDSFWNVFQL